MKFEKITLTNQTIEAVDIHTMNEMNDDEYTQFLQSDELFFVDHHGILRSSVSGYPLATTKAQLKLLISDLNSRISQID